MTDTTETIAPTTQLTCTQYPAYKDSGVDWLGEMPTHWEVIKSKYLWKEIIDLSISGEETLLSVSQYSGVNAREDGNRTESLVGYKKVKENDLVINIMLAWLGGLGLSAYDGVVSPAYAVYRQTRKINPKFLHYLYRTDSYLDEFTRRSKGVVPSRWRMYTDDFGQVITTLPPLAEQTRIAEFLDRKIAQIDQAIAQKERLIELLNERRQLLIHKAVTRGLDPNVPMKASGIEWIGEIPAHWTIARLGFYTTVIQTGPFGSQLHSHEYIEGGIPVINPSHIAEGKIVPDYSQTISESKHQSLKQHTLRVGDLVFGRRGEMGRCAVISSVDVVAICGTGSIKLSLKKEKLYPEFIGFYLRTSGMREWFSLNSVGSTMENLNTDILSKVPLIVLPLDEQKQIVRYIYNLFERFDVTIRNEERQIQKLQELKSTLINSAVTGKIRV